VDLSNLIRGASPLGLPYPLSRAPLRRRAVNRASAFLVGINCRSLRRHRAVGTRLSRNTTARTPRAVRSAGTALDCWAVRDLRISDGRNVDRSGGA